MTLATMDRAQRQQRIDELRAALRPVSRARARARHDARQALRRAARPRSPARRLGRDYKAADGTDCRNYGVLDGLPEARALFAELLEVEPAEVIVGGNSSLALMHDTVVQCLLKGVPDAPPWRASDEVKFLCPSPGYDRHFAICEHYGIEMLTDPDERRRAGHGQGRAAGRRRRAHQGHLDRAPLQQPDRRRLLASGGRAPGAR